MIGCLIAFMEGVRCVNLHVVGQFGASLEVRNFEEFLAAL